MNHFAKKVDSVLDLIGNTPLVKIEKRNGVELYGKLEFLNPGGSIKDRAVKYMILEAERKVNLKDKIILESTSGNTGIALALISKIKGYKAKIIVPRATAKEKMSVMEFFGADIEIVDGDSEDAMNRAGEIYESDPEKYYYLNQYSNESNIRAHYETTGWEILEQTDRKVTHFVAGIGTGGTITGIGKRLKEYNPKIKIIGVQPEEHFHGIEGLKNLDTEETPKTLDLRYVDGIRKIKTERAYEAMIDLGSKGILAGPSSGASYATARDIFKDLDKGIIVAIFPDGGAKYLNTELWREFYDNFKKASR